MQGKNIKAFDLGVKGIINRIKKTECKKIIFAGEDSNLIRYKLNNEIKFELGYENGYNAEDLLSFALWFIKSNSSLEPPKPIYLRKSEAEMALIKKKR